MKVAFFNVESDQNTGMMKDEALQQFMINHRLAQVFNLCLHIYYIFPRIFYIIASSIFVVFQSIWNKIKDTLLVVVLTKRYFQSLNSPVRDLILLTLNEPSILRAVGTQYTHVLVYLQKCHLSTII